MFSFQMRAGQSCLGITYSQGSWNDKHMQLRGWDLTALRLRGQGDKANRSGWPSQSKGIKRRGSARTDSQSGFVRSSCYCHWNSKDRNEWYSRSVDIYTHFWIILQYTLRHLHTFLYYLPICYTKNLYSYFHGASLPCDTIREERV